MARSDDLATLFGGSPDGTDMRYGQGVIRAWNPDTFENVVEWRGTLLTNLPVWSGADALTYQVGDVVSLRGTGSGASTWAIDGRLITPGPGAGARTVGWMTTSLARELAAAIFADRIRVARVNAAQSRSSTAFGDLATPGPTVSGVEVVSGTALVILGAEIYTGGNALGLSGGVMGVQISGATSRAPTFDDSLHLMIGEQSFSLSASRAIVVTGLNPGIHTFTAKYASLISGVTASFDYRVLAVVAL